MYQHKDDNLLYFVLLTVFSTLGIIINFFNKIRNSRSLYIDIKQYSIV